METERGDITAGPCVLVDMCIGECERTRDREGGETVANVIYSNCVGLD